MDCLTRARRYRDTKCKDEKFEKVEQKIELHNKEGVTKEHTSTKVESKEIRKSKEAVNIVKIQSPRGQQEKNPINVSQMDLERSPDAENQENEKSAFMVSGKLFESSFLKNIPNSVVRIR